MRASRRRAGRKSGFGRITRAGLDLLQEPVPCYDGPRLAFQVAACAAPDGSYWALQSWRRTLPNFDGAPASGLGTWELHLSHWSGAIATLDVWTDWVYGGRYHHLFGRLTYDGKPVYGFSASRVGSPLDGYGRNIYVDTFDSRYGKGWRRENAFLAHQPTGVFCYGFYRFSSRGPGNGAKYRLSAIGPGVTPDVSTTVAGLHDSTRTTQRTSRTNGSRTRCRTPSPESTRSATFTDRVAPAAVGHTPAPSARPRAGSTRRAARRRCVGGRPNRVAPRRHRADRETARSGTAPRVRDR